MHTTCAQELKHARAEAAQQQERAGSGVEASSSGSGEDSDGSQDDRERRRRSKKRGGRDRKEGRRTRKERRKHRTDGKKAKKRGREEKVETKLVSSCARRLLRYAATSRHADARCLQVTGASTDAFGKYGVVRETDLDRYVASQALFAWTWPLLVVISQGARCGG